MKLRPMRWWDLPEVVAIEREVFPRSAWSEESFWGELARRGIDRFYLVADDGRVRGYAGLWIGDGAEVQTIAVDPAAQGAGIGRALLSELREEAVRRGCRRLDLEVRVGNLAALGLYEAAGFRRVRTRPRYYPDGEDAYVMTVELP